MGLTMSDASCPTTPGSRKHRDVPRGAPSMRRAPSDARPGLRALRRRSNRAPASFNPGAFADAAGAGTGRLHILKLREGRGVSEWCSHDAVARGRHAALLFGTFGALGTSIVNGGRLRAGVSSSNRSTRSIQGEAEPARSVQRVKTCTGVMPSGKVKSYTRFGGGRSWTEGVRTEVRRGDSRKRKDDSIEGDSKPKRKVRQWRPRRGGFGWRRLGGAGSTLTAALEGIGGGRRHEGRSWRRHRGFAGGISQRDRQP